MGAGDGAEQRDFDARGRGGYFEGDGLTVGPVGATGTDGVGWLWDAFQQVGRDEDLVTVFLGEADVFGVGA